MPNKKTPSSTMYAELKRLGISNREAAFILLNTQLSFDGKTLDARINDSSQLTRRIVHTEPGEIPLGSFHNFHFSCPKLMRVLIDKRLDNRRCKTVEQARADLENELSTNCAQRMEETLRECGIDESIYHNMVFYIGHAELPDQAKRCLLYLMMLVVTGCTGNPKTAAVYVVEYADEVLGADFQTAQTVINAASWEKVTDTDITLGLVRVVDGKIRPNIRLHVLDANGTVIGLLPTAIHTISDVGEDASLEHARIWREDGHWYIEDLNSTNGTVVVNGASGEKTIVAPPSSGDNEAPASKKVEIFPTDMLYLGSQTCFIVMPVLGE